MKRLSVFILFAVLLSASLAQAEIIIYNQNNPPDASDLPSGGWGTYRGFYMLPDGFDMTIETTGADAGKSIADFDTVYLTDLIIRHSGSGGSSPTAPTGDPTNAVMKIYTEQTPGTGSFVGDSLNINDMSYGGSERNITYNFDNLALDPTRNYYFYFANTSGNPADINDVDWTDGRLRVSNDAGLTFSPGNLINPSFGDQDTACDAVFSLQASSIPEPATIGFFGLAALLHFCKRSLLPAIRSLLRK